MQNNGNIKGKGLLLFPFFLELSLHWGKK